MEEQKRSTEEKIDLILKQVLINHGEITILKGQMKTIDERIEKKLDEKLEKKFVDFEEKLEKRLDEKLEKRFTDFEEKLEKTIDEKLDKRFIDFKKDMGTILVEVFKEEENRIDKNAKEIQKLPCVSLKAKLKKFVSKTN